MRNIQFNGIGECMSESCRYKSDCAQHKSAGDFRSEIGSVPNVYTDSDYHFWCDSAVSGEFSDEAEGFTVIDEFLKK